MAAAWNPWRGCHKLSDGCLNCYVHMGDAKHGRDSSLVVRTPGFDAPVRRLRKGDYKMAGGQMVWTCFSSDFFVEDADQWRPQAWDMIRERSDLHFFMITKRIDRLADCVPDDWGDGWDNVTICCTMENQDRVDYRMPIYKAAPIRHKVVVCEPLLGPIDLAPWLDATIERVGTGGESGGRRARPCHYEWITALRDQCAAHGVAFRFRQTGSNFYRGGIHYAIPRREQFSQARKAGIDIERD